jgi:hypothetical protein
MDTIAYRDAVIEFDRDATHAEYAKLRRGAADECHCEAFQNFIAARDAGLVYPKEANDLLAALGTDLGKEWELCDFAEPTREPHMYSGAFNIVGRLVSGEGSAFDITPDFRMRLTGEGLGSDWRPELGFRVEFDVRVPWVINQDSTD